MRRHVAVPALVGVLALAACTTIPAGPSVMVLPGTSKTFEQFQVDDAVCRQWGAQQVGITPRHAEAESTVAGAAVGTLVGAGLGAAIGAATGSPGAGAAIGAGAGLLGGTAVGASAGQSSSWSVQRRYDVAYQQCMYAKGNQIPGVVAASPRAAPTPPPPPPPAPRPGAPPPATPLGEVPPPPPSR